MIHQIISGQRKEGDVNRSQKSCLPPLRKLFLNSKGVPLLSHLSRVLIIVMTGT